MAFRIHDSIVRGEIDNRIKGIIQGRIWLEGRSEPIVLELTGNAHPDLAGCQLTFTNPRERIADPRLEALHSVQRGTAGDLTASRKIRVFNAPLEEALQWPGRKEIQPEPMANAIYLEWFSETNGRVVIESAHFDITISPREWSMSREEDAQRGQDAADGMQRFMQQLTENIERHQPARKDPETWDEHDYERLLREADARTAKYGELLDKYGHSEAAHSIIRKEMGWDHDGEIDGDDGDDGDEVDDDGGDGIRHERWSIEEINALCAAALDEPPPEPDPEREGVDWIRTPDGEIRHPLEHRCYESAFRFWRRVDALGLESTADRDLDRFVFEFHTAAAKLAGALNGIADGSHDPKPAFTVAYLKRALDRLHHSQAGLEGVAARRVLPEDLVAEARRELLEIRQDLLDLIDHFRGRH